MSTVNTYLNTSAGQSVLGGVTIAGGEQKAVEAADKLIATLHKTINSSGLSPSAIAAVSDISHSAATRVGGSASSATGIQYKITVSFSGYLGRPSLDEARYGSIDDIVALLNNGVGHTMRPVHGTWNGKETWSRTTIPGAHFIESAVSEFISAYGSQYRITSYSIDVG